MWSTVATRFADLVPGEPITFVDRIDEIADRFDRLPHQRPSTCGAYSLSYLLGPLGYERHAGHSLADEDYLAHLAAVTIEAYEVEVSADIGRRVAAGTLSVSDALATYPQAWYRFPVAASSDPAVIGTSVTGLARAGALATGGDLVSLPVAARRNDGSVQLTPDRWTALLDRLSRSTSDWRWHGILNYQTDALLRPDDPAYTVENLRAPDPGRSIPLDDWGVGHFGGLAGLWLDRGAGQWWLALLDTYKERGFAGYQPQPAELVRQGLARTDGREGGLLIIVPRTALRPAADAMDALGLDLRMWDNGSSPPADWRWTLGA